MKILAALVGNRRRRLIPGLVLLTPLVLMAVFAPHLPLQDPELSLSDARHLPPSAAHPFGTDAFGMDVLSRVVHGARIDFVMTVASVALALLLGVPVGAAAGYFGGTLENITERLVEVLQSFPVLLSAMMIQIVFGRSLSFLIVVIGIYLAPFYVKLVRSVVKPLKDVEFIRAARVAGQTTSQILVRHLIPNALPEVVSQFALSAAVAIRILSGLSFLGLGVETPTPEWGAMIQIGAGWMVFGKWWPSLFPGLALFVTVFALTQIGGELERMFSLREQ